MAKSYEDEIENPLEGEARKARFVGWEFINAKPGSLGEAEVVNGLVRQFMVFVTSIRKQQNEGTLEDEAAAQQIDARAGEMQAIFFGGEPEKHPPLPAWNTPAQLGVSLIEPLSMDRPPEDAVRGAFVQIAIDTIAALKVAEEGQPDEVWKWQIEATADLFTDLLLGRPVQL